MQLQKEKFSDDEEYDSELTSAEDSDIDPHEHDALLPTSVKNPTESYAESINEEKLAVDSEASYKMGRFTKTKAVKRDWWIKSFNQQKAPFWTKSGRNMDNFNELGLIS